MRAHHHYDHALPRLASMMYVLSHFPFILSMTPAMPRWPRPSQPPHARAVASATIFTWVPCIFSTRTVLHGRRFSL